MTKKEAKQIIDRLHGWDKPKAEKIIDYDGQETYRVTAVDPTDKRRKVYNADTGYFA